MSRRRHLTGLAAIAVPAVLAAACGDPVSGTALPLAGSSQQLYVSIGDSYAAGYEATGPQEGTTTRNGFVYRVVEGAAAKGYDLRLANFACGGASTASVLEEQGCDPDALGPGGIAYPEQSQAAAAVDFLERNRGDVALITVSLGGNDVTGCAVVPDPVACVGEAVQVVKTNLGRLLADVRAAAGPDVPIVGITYPDVILGEYLSDRPGSRQLAEISVVAFQRLINPALEEAYAAVDGELVDVTEATGAYGSLEQTRDLPPYGVIPEPVARVCELTYYCTFGDIHPRPEGYQLISDLVVQELPPR